MTYKGEGSLFSILEKLPPLASLGFIPTTLKAERLGVYLL